MEKINFTPGPWKVTKNGDSVVPESTNALLADVFDGSSAPITNMGTAKANAALIAASPEMYEALKATEKALTLLYPGHAEPDDEHLEEYKSVWSAVMDARSAISKAEGRA